MMGRRLIAASLAFTASGCAGIKIRNHYEKCETKERTSNPRLECLRELVKTYKDSRLDSKELHDAREEYEQLLWKRAEEKNTIEGYVEYLNESEEGRYRYEAQQLILQMKDDEKWAETDIRSMISLRMYINAVERKEIPGLHLTDARVAFAIEEKDLKLLKELVSERELSKEQMEICSLAIRILEAVESGSLRALRYIVEDRKIDIYRREIENYLDRNDPQRIFKKVEEEGTIEAYLKFMEQFPHSDEVEAARAALEGLEYEQAKGNPEKIKTFLEKYPATRYKGEIDQFIFEEAVKGLEKADIYGWLTFVERYKNDERFKNQEAFNKVYEKFEEKLWKDAKTSYLAGKYLELYPDGKHFEDMADEYMKSIQPVRLVIDSEYVIFVNLLGTPVSGRTEIHANFVPLNFAPFPRLQSILNGKVLLELWQVEEAMGNSPPYSELTYKMPATGKWEYSKSWGYIKPISGEWKNFIDALQKLQDYANISDEEINSANRYDIFRYSGMYGVEAEFDHYRSLDDMGKSPYLPRLKKAVKAACNGYGRELRRLISGEYYYFKKGYARIGNRHTRWPEQGMLLRSSSEEGEVILEVNRPEWDPLPAMTSCNDEGECDKDPPMLRSIPEIKLTPQQLELLKDENGETRVAFKYEFKYAAGYGKAHSTKVGWGKRFMVQMLIKQAEVSIGNDDNEPMIRVVTIPKYDIDIRAITIPRYDTDRSISDWRVDLKVK